VDWASQAYCNFAIFVTVIAFLTSLGSFARALNYIRKNTDASLFGAFCQVIADALMAVFTLIAALFITLGFKTW
jgi:Co/Zn/Cd efflux system component